MLIREKIEEGLAYFMNMRDPLTYEKRPHGSEGRKLYLNEIGIGPGLLRSVDVSSDSKLAKSLALVINDNGDDIGMETIEKIEFYSETYRRSI